MALLDLQSMDAPQNGAGGHASSLSLLLCSASQASVGLCL
ncbi:SapB/AmfS family lanthipeptide [Streptomyces sp. H39-S7]|nr:SapB/AmfS family lanthipeptide [Streptomyces sp. H39-S7]MCZ4122622.1 SapB/AmfS family lanthipeptide [Streptomyces sp. H39-S7]